MVGIPRLHGRTPLQRYLCRHVFHDDSSYGNSVFNTTYNINGGNICGGGFWGGFAGGIAMEIGANIGGFLSRFIGGGGCFGGSFPLFSTFSSFPMFGGGTCGCSPLMSWLGGGTKDKVT